MSWIVDYVAHWRNEARAARSLNGSLGVRVAPQVLRNVQLLDFSSSAFCAEGVRTLAGAVQDLDQLRNLRVARCNLMNDFS